MAQAKQAKEKNQIPVGKNKQTSNIRPTETNRPQGLARHGEGKNRGLSRREHFAPLSPFSLLNSFREEMDRLFDDFGFGRGLAFPRLGGFAESAFDWAPQTEVFERDNKLIVQVDLPGLSKDDINVDIDENHITIRGERRSEHKQEEEGFYQSERSYGSFYRAIPLPEGIDPDEARAEFRDGVLEITMPLPEQRSRGRRLEIGESTKTKTAKSAG